jgi:hypothetical protein
MSRHTAIVSTFIFAWLATAGGALAQGTTGFVFGGGFENVFYDGVEPGPPPDFLTVLASSVDDKSFGGTLFAEYAWSPYIAVGVGYEAGSSAKLAQGLAIKGLEVVTFDLRDGVFEPNVFDIHVAPTFPIFDRLEVFGVVGAARWSSASSNSIVARVGGTEVFDIPSMQENDGWTGIFGGGITVWVADWIGFRARYHYLSMQEDADDDRVEIDVGMHKFAWMAVVNIN